MMIVKNGEIDYEKRSMEGWCSLRVDGQPPTPSCHSRAQPGTTCRPIRVVDLWTTARLVRGVQPVGGWRCFVDEPRRHLALLRELVARGRATPPPRAQPFDAAALPTDCFFHIPALAQRRRRAVDFEVLAAGAIPEETSRLMTHDWSTRDDKDPGTPPTSPRRRLPACGSSRRMADGRGR